MIDYEAANRDLRKKLEESEAEMAVLRSVGAALIAALDQRDPAESTRLLLELSKLTNTPFKNVP